jgi:glycosyltransferase involved in cell wall biosynthesis
VLDSGSVDRTVELATNLGARVVEDSWRGYANQKNYAAEQAEHDWILSLDADEALSEALEARSGISKSAGRPMTHIQCRAWRSTWAAGFPIAAGIPTARFACTTARKPDG